jgi:hypothetical protein
MTIWSLTGREALQQTEETTAIDVESESVVERGGRRKLFSVSGGQQKEDVGQNRETELTSGILGIVEEK